MQLTDRLQIIADWVEKGSRTADIGTDHAYIPIWLAEHGICDYQVAGDINRDPYERAAAAVRMHKLESCISVRLGSGLDILQDDDQIDTVIIAGMGAGTIIDILSEGLHSMPGVVRLLLQPMTDVSDVRLWLADNGWCLTRESLAEENNHLYEIMMAEKGEETAEGLYLKWGPRLLEQGHPLLLRYLHKLKRQREMMLQGLKRSEREEMRLRAEQIKTELAELDRLLIRWS